MVSYNLICLNLLDSTEQTHILFYTQKYIERGRDRKTDRQREGEIERQRESER